MPVTFVVQLKHGHPLYQIIVTTFGKWLLKVGRIITYVNSKYGKDFTAFTLGRVAT